jgi:hypothetical protein
MVQRIEVLGVSGWLLALALAVRRRRPG